MSKRIDEVEVDNIRAIAIDTNVFKSGRYSRRQLETLAREARAVEVEAPGCLKLWVEGTRGPRG